MAKKTISKKKRTMRFDRALLEGAKIEPKSFESSNEAADDSAEDSLQESLPPRPEANEPRIEVAQVTTEPVVAEESSTASSPAAAAPSAPTESVSTGANDGMKEQRWPTISLCMIVKDEEEWIAQAINSVKPIVSEIVVVDTGSKDRTIQIAKALGAKVLHRPWDDDFSAPRNLSIQNATGDWILVLDADEAIAASDLQTLREQTLDRSICWEFLQRHYSDDHRLSEFTPVRGEFPEWERSHAGYFESNCVRMFPNHDGIEYRGRVHELAEHSIRELNKHKIQRTQVRIHHYGHTEAVLKKKDKSMIYTPLGEKKLGDDPNHWQNFFEMGVEHNRNGRYQESVLAFLRSLQMNYNYVPTWVNMGYVLCEMGRYRQAEVSLMGALDIDQKNDEAYCNLGVVYMRTNRLKQAQEMFRRAIQLNPKYINAYCNLGKALAMEKRLPEAVQVYRRALEQMPKCATAKADLGAIYLSANGLKEAEFFLRGALQDDPSMDRALYLLGQVFKASGRVQDALAALSAYVVKERNKLSPQPAAEQVKWLTQVAGECEMLKRVIVAAQQQQQQPQPGA